MKKREKQAKTLEENMGEEAETVEFARVGGVLFTLHFPFTNTSQYLTNLIPLSGDDSFNGNTDFEKHLNYDFALSLKIEALIPSADGEEATTNVLYGKE